ncbi:MAG: hypothetical protein M3198_07070 [Actinomycetota bacterium]|nr:hypothetical protein [Actinomycetota bacterium]
MDQLLGVLDSTIDGVRRCRPETTVDPGAMLATLGRDSASAIEAAMILLQRSQSSHGRGYAERVEAGLREIFGDLASSSERVSAY